MASEISSNRTIAKNTMFLYFRMMFTMLISLYTSRVILQKLGVTDFGLYQSVGGVVGFLSFINGALSTGSSRFLTFELGTGNFEKLKKVFSTVLTVHILLSFVIVLLAETLGLWFVYNKLVIPPNRFAAVVYTYQFSVLACILSITQVPYNASIISHEKMSVYAYISIYEVVMKLLICYLLSIHGFDKLELYTTFYFFVNVSIMIFYRYYCVRNFKETKYKFLFDKKIFKEIASFSTWSLFAGISFALTGQGIIVLLNMFFTPAVVTARAISLQVNTAAVQFVNSFRTAANPQIVKKYAAKDYDGSKKLLLLSTRFSYYLMLVICLPVCFVSGSLLHLWLGQVPPYADIFLQLIVIQSLFQVFDTSFYTALYAKGRLKENALISPTLGIVAFPIIYVLFKLGYSPVSLSWAMIIVNVLLGVIIKPVLLVKIVNYTYKDILNVFSPCLKVTVLSFAIAIVIDHFVRGTSIIAFFTEVALIVFFALLVIFFIGIEKNMKEQFVKILVKKFNI